MNNSKGMGLLLKFKSLIRIFTC